MCFIISGFLHFFRWRLQNNKVMAFSQNLGRKIMLLVLQGAKEKFSFKLHNFCIMPTHIHLLLTPAENTNISQIMQWIKTRSAKRWNFIHGSTDHLWGARFFARPINDLHDFFTVKNYIDQNVVKAGLTHIPQDWKASGAYYIANDINGFVDFIPFDRLAYIKLLPEAPSAPYCLPSVPENTKTSNGA